MKISNEAKIGVIAIITIILLFFGFSFLKGKNVFRNEIKMFAVYNDVLGLKKSNPVVINGLQVGMISDIDGGKDMKNLMVTVSFSKDVNIPENSVAVINPNLLGSPSLEIQLGDAAEYKKSGDTIMTAPSTGAIDEALKVLDPVLYEVKNAVKSLDSVLAVVGSTFDPDTKDNVKDMVAHLNAVSQSLIVSSNSLEKTLDPEASPLGKSLKNINSFTGNLAQNNQRLDSIMQNVNTTTENLANINLQETFDSIHMAINNLKTISEKLNSNDGTLGRLINDETLYKNLESTTHKLNILIDDVRVHPRRYVNVSVFGKKDKKNYITAPLVDDTSGLAGEKTSDN